MEAAGVEPASEIARYEKTTCVASSEDSSAALEPARRRRTSPIGFGLRLRTEAVTLSFKMTLTGQREGSSAEAAT